jgi:dTMP kinase
MAPCRRVNSSGHTGVLVAIEGIDGAGKTTQANLVADELRRLGLEVVLSKEPTNGPHGQRLRDSAWSGRLSAQEELEEFIADRREHVRDLIQPALHAGRIVLLDRYYYSTAAYQGARGLDWRDIVRRNEEFAPVPDLLVIIEIAPEIGVLRVSRRDGRANHFEKVEDLRQCHDIFSALTGRHIRRLSGELSPLEVRDDIVTCILQRQCDRIALNGSSSQPEKLERLRQLIGTWAGVQVAALD